MGTVLLLLQAAAALLPEIEQVLPAAQTLLAGGTITPAEEAQIAGVTTSLNSQAAAAAQTVDPTVA